MPNKYMELNKSKAIAGVLGLGLTLSIIILPTHIH